MATRVKKASRSVTTPRKTQKVDNQIEGVLRVQKDLDSLLDAANLAALFLDRELRIRKYTPTARKILNITAADQGRPIARFKHRLGYDQILEDASQVLYSLDPVERQVRTKNGKWFSLRIHPHCIQKGKVDGVTIIIIDITTIKETEPSTQEWNGTLEASIPNLTQQRDEANRKLTQTRDTFHTLFYANPIPAALTRVDDDVLMSVNAAFLKYFNLTREDVIGHTAQELKLGMELQSNERTSLMAQLQKEGGIRNYEREMILPSGKTVTLLASLQYLEIDDTPVILSAFVDITERKQAEQMIRDMVDAAPDATVIINEEGNIVLVNKQLESVFGYARQDLMGKPVRTLIPERFHEIHPQHRMRYFHEPKVRPMGSGLKLHGRRKDGTEFPVEISLSPLKTLDGTLAIAAIRDITERIETERKMRQLSAILSEAEQRERRRISQMLHDDLQQRLFAIKTHLSVLNNAYNQQNWGELHTVIGEMDEWLSESISITRNLSIDINPVIPHDGDFANALTWLSTQMQKQYALNVTLRTDSVDTNFDDSLRVLLFQAVRELLFNVVKHAETLQAAVTLEKVADQIRITVSDEGKGFDPIAVMKDPGIAHGLLNIRQHLDLMGCRMEIASSFEAGTRISIYCPNSG